MLVADTAPHIIERVAARQQAYWRSRGNSFNLAARLIDVGAPQFAEVVRSCIRRLHHKL